MPLIRCFDPHHQLHHLAVTGTSTLSEWQEGLAGVCDDAAAPHAPILLDLTSAAHAPRDWELTLLAFLLRKIVQHRRCRLAIHSPAPEHGVSLALLAFSCDAVDAIEFFPDLDQARAWLAASR
ncbi:MAG: hypothetical protein IAE82_21150 [Opitutaceae bacterium]|nr:hypothetical protein [Opitutaceae bacterium]